MFPRLKNSITLAGLSAGWMYLFDPDLGNRRRALLRDQFEHLVNRIVRAYEVTMRDMSNRLGGTASAMKKRISGSEDSPDEVVHDRVRSKLGRYSSHAAAIETEVHDGCVILHGPILASEVQSVMNAIRSVDGVSHVDNRMEVHTFAENVAALQGGSCPRGEPLAWMQENWSPTARFLAGVAGSTMVMNGMGKRTLPAMLCGGAGVLLLARAISNQSLLSPRRTAHGSSTGGKTTQSSAASAPNSPSEEDWGGPRAGSNVPQRRDHAPKRPTSAAQPGVVPEPLVDEPFSQTFSDSPSLGRS